MGAFPNLEWEFRLVCSVQGFWGFGGLRLGIIVNASRRLPPLVQ